MKYFFVVLIALTGSMQTCFAQSIIQKKYHKEAKSKSGGKNPSPIRKSSDRRKSRYCIVDTGQNHCYGTAGPIAYPKQGTAFYGQDAQYQGVSFAFKDNHNGTITDLNTGLMWQKSPDFIKRDYEEAKAYARNLKLGRHNDWRIPSIKELFSIANFSGNIRTMTPYIDTRVFDFKYPDTSKGWRLIDAQYRSNTEYLGITMAGDRASFGFNFADGRIKGYPISGPGARRFGAAKQFIRCVRGPKYGVNDFVDNRNGTISDRSTGLMWMKYDSGKPVNWQQALAYAEGLKYAGYSDWRLPNVKELQSIVDYSRAPDATVPSARGPAIDPIFKVTDSKSWCWTSTTHLDNLFGYYVCFGKALSAKMWKGKQMDAHGAGAVRSDPKTGDAKRWPNGLGPQADEIRINNYVRCVRGGRARPRMTQPTSSMPRKQYKPVKRYKPTQVTPLAKTRWILHLDKDKDGKVSRSEFDGPPQHFNRFDKNRDGFINESEAPTGPPVPPRGGANRRMNRGY